MKRSMPLWQLMGFAVTSLLGTLLHFLYEWTGESVLAVPFSGVNESTWEHMKLLYVPAFLYAVIQSFFFKNRKEFWCVKWIGISAGLTLIPVLFYTYNGVFGPSPDFVNIAIFFVAAAAAFLLENKLFKDKSISCNHPIIPFVALCLAGVLFIVFAFVTPQIPLFEDPLTGAYGVQL